MPDLRSDNLERLLLLRQRSVVTTAFLSVQIAQEERRLMEESGHTSTEGIVYKELEIKALRNHYRNLCHECGVDPQL